MKNCFGRVIIFVYKLFINVITQIVNIIYIFFYKLFLKVGEIILYINFIGGSFMAAISFQLTSKYKKIY